MSDATIDRERTAGIARLLDEVRAALPDAAPKREQMELVRAALCRLAARRDFWDRSEFEDPAADEKQRRYLLHEEPDQTLALYLMVMRKGKRTPVHDHQTWACIAAVEGRETNELYRAVVRDPVRGVGVVEPLGTKVVGPGDGLALLGDDVHAVAIDDDMIRHLHLYGRALETLHDRVVFHPEQRRCEPMLIHVSTLRRLGRGPWSVAQGDRMIDGHRWSFVDTQGPGDVLLLLPGAQGNCRAFDHLLEKLSQRWRVIALSYPALGDARALASGALGFLLAAGIARAHVFGTSLGGFVAQWMALLEPVRMGHLLLSNTFDDPTPAQDAAELERVRAQTDEAFKAAALQKLEAAPAGAFRDRMLALVRTQPGDSLRQRRIAVLSAPALPAFTRDPATVTIIDAQDDPILPPPMRDALPARYPGAAHRRFATGGHHLHFSRADEVLELMLSFAQEQHP